MGQTEVNTVDARELHAHLGVKKDFSNWIKPKLADAMLDEGVDYLLLAQKGEQKKDGRGGHNKVTYILTIDTAKHIALMSRTHKGKEVRAYFIEVEKRAREKAPSLDFGVAKSLEAMAEGITALAGAVKGIERTIKSVEERVSKLEKPSAKTTIHINPPTPQQVATNRTSYLLQLFRNLVEINPGINQSQLMNLAGFRKDDKRTIRLLRDMQGTLWQTTRYANHILYYPIED